MIELDKKTMKKEIGPDYTVKKTNGNFGGALQRFPEIFLQMIEFHKAT